MGLTTASSKLRSAILFKTEWEQTLYKRLISDLGESKGLTPSETVLDLALDDAAKSGEAKSAARALYAVGGDCTSVFESLFRDWAAIEPDKGSDRAIVEAFYRYAAAYGLVIDTRDNRMYHLRDQWNSVVNLVEHVAKNGDFLLSQKVRDGRSLERQLQEENTCSSIISHIIYMVDAWDILSGYTYAYRALMDFAGLAHSGYPNMSESAADRLGLLRLIDDYVFGGQQKGGVEQPNEHAAS